MNLYIYKRPGDREFKDDDIHYPPPLPGQQDDVAICKAHSKEEALEVFKKYFTLVENKHIFSIDELFWVKNDNISLLTPY